jgi:transposase
VHNKADKDELIETLLLERDELYQELSKLRQIDGGALEKAEKKNAQYEKVIKEKDQIIKKLTDQLAWLRRKFWKPSSEKYTPSDPAQRKLDFDGLDILP